MTHAPLRLVRREQPGASPHAERFLERYETLLAVARRLVGFDRALAEDLLHDGYVQFVLSSPDLRAINELDAYLVGLLRNLHLARQRRQHRESHRELESIDFDSAQIALRTAGPHRLIVRDTLARLCGHVRERRHASRSASVLALRFLIGYYPSEIAAIVRTPTRAVYDWLREARSEARLYLTAAPRSGPRPEAVPLPPVESTDPLGLLRAVQTTILGFSRPPCPNVDDVASWYDPAREGALPVAALAHIVGCYHCLNLVTTRLGLDDLATRLGGDSGNEPPSGGNGSSAGRVRRANGERERRRALQRRARDVFEHQPGQLFVSVNGLSLGALVVDTLPSEAQWTVRLEEPVGFIEVTSEQSLVLAHLMVSPLPAGDVVQRLRVPLSDERELVVTYDAGEDPGLVRVNYDGTVTPRVADRVARSGQTPLLTFVSEAAAQPSRRWLRGSLVAAAVLLVALFATWRTNRPGSAPVMDAWTVMARADAAVTADRLETGRARHRRSQLAITTPSGVERYRIEQWDVGGAPTRATRLFDAQGRLVAGEWVSPQGVRIMRRGTLPDDRWRDGLSPQAFRPYMQGAACNAEERGRRIIVTCAFSGHARLLDLVMPTVLAQATVTRAVLELAADTLRIERLTVSLAPGQPVTEVLIEEEHRAVVPIDDVPASAFVAETIAVGGTPAAPRRPASTVWPSLQVQVAEVLSRLPASAAVQTSRMPDGRLQVAGHVASASDRRELITGLRALPGADILEIAVETIGAPARTGVRQPHVAADGRAELRDLPEGPAPFERYLARDMPATTDPGRLVETLATQALGPARQLQRDAVALDTALATYPPSSVVALDAAGRAAWHTLTNRHAEAIAHALATLDAILAPYFPDGSVDDPAGEDIGPAGLPEAVRALRYDASTVADDLQSAFTSDAGSATVVSPTLRQRIQRALRTAERVREGLRLVP